MFEYLNPYVQYGKDFFTWVINIPNFSLYVALGILGFALSFLVFAYINAARYASAEYEKRRKYWADRKAATDQQVSVQSGANGAVQQGGQVPVQVDQLQREGVLRDSTQGHGLSDGNPLKKGASDDGGDFVRRPVRAKLPRKEVPTVP